MNLSNEFDPIRDWATERGIYEKGDPKTQYLKFQEEAGELSKAILKNDHEEIIDAVGDCVVTLTNLAALCGTTIENCINTAYSEIKNRKGKMENGTFVKQDTYRIYSDKDAGIFLDVSKDQYDLWPGRKDLNPFTES